METLNHLVEGAGPVVVLLHAGVGDLRMWDAQAADLASTHTVARCDLRGFGRSAPTPSSCDAEDVLTLLDHVDVRDFALVGASYGGYVALQVASTVPERVRRLVLLCPLAEVVEPDEPLRALWAEEGRLLDAGDLDGATELNVQAWLGPEADDDARALVRRMQHDALVQQSAAGETGSRELPVTLERLTMPTTVVSGALDQPFFVATARELVAQLPDATLVELDWAGHLPSLERPDETTRLIVEALAG